MYQTSIEPLSQFQFPSSAPSRPVANFICNMAAECLLNILPELIWTCLGGNITAGSQRRGYKFFVQHQPYFWCAKWRWSYCDVSFNAKENARLLHIFCCWTLSAAQKQLRDETSTAAQLNMDSSTQTASGWHFSCWTWTAANKQLHTDTSAAVQLKINCST